MLTKSSPHEKLFVPGTSRHREACVTLRLEMARDQAQLLEMGARIKELREAHGYTQQRVADHVGVTLRTYQFWQAGKSPPSRDSLEKLAELFCVTPTYITRGETPKLEMIDGDGEDADIKQQLEAMTGLVRELVDQVRLLRGELTVRDAEERQRTGPSEQPTPDLQGEQPR